MIIEFIFAHPFWALGIYIATGTLLGFLRVWVEARFNLDTMDADVLLPLYTAAWPLLIWLEITTVVAEYVYDSSRRR